MSSLRKPGIADAFPTLPSRSHLTRSDLRAIASQMDSIKEEQDLILRISKKILLQESISNFLDDQGFRLKSGSTVSDSTLNGGPLEFATESKRGGFG